MARDGYAQEVKIIQSLGMRIKTHMECIVCKNLERDTNDIQRKIDELRSDLRKIKTASEKEYIAFEMSALVARGEFSIVIAGLGAALEPQIGPLSAAYVLFLAVLGPILTRLIK